jgi:iron(III) transport system permease protein
VTLIVLPLAFSFAYALTRSCMPYKALVSRHHPGAFAGTVTAVSDFADLLVWQPGCAQNLVDKRMGIDEIYGAPGVVLAECIAVFPHTLMILVTALSMSDARLFEAADAMGTTAMRKFFTITLPGAKYGLISAAMVTFTLVITDFGIPKVIGGNFNVLATDVFKLVIGQQDFAKGAVVAILLLTPAVLSFGVDNYVSRAKLPC